jgi:hypothetical protein
MEVLMVTANPDDSPSVAVLGLTEFVFFLLRRLDKRAVLPIHLSTREGVMKRQMF